MGLWVANVGSLSGTPCEIRLRIPNVPPEPRGPERLLVQTLARVMLESARQDENAGRAPSKWNHCGPLMSQAVNPADQYFAVKHMAFDFTFDVFEL